MKSKILKNIRNGLLGGLCIPFYPFFLSIAILIWVFSDESILACLHLLNLPLRIFSDKYDVYAQYYGDEEGL